MVQLTCERAVFSKCPIAGWPTEQTAEAIITFSGDHFEAKDRKRMALLHDQLPLHGLVIMPWPALYLHTVSFFNFGLNLGA